MGRSPPDPQRLGGGTPPPAPKNHAGRQALPPLAVWDLGGAGGVFAPTRKPSGAARSVEFGPVGRGGENRCGGGALLRFFRAICPHRHHSAPPPLAGRQAPERHRLALLPVCHRGSPPVGPLSAGLPAAAATPEPGISGGGGPGGAGGPSLWAKGVQERGCGWAYLRLCLRGFSSHSGPPRRNRHRR